MRGALTVALACAACTSTDPYEVLATADLAPGAANITGTLQMLGTGEAVPPPYEDHTFVPFHVRLPDDTPRRIRLYGSAACDAPHADAVVSYNLGEIRRVGDETHFFIRDVEIGSRQVAVDVRTRSAFIVTEPEAPLYYVFDLVAVVEDVLPGDNNAPGPTGDAPGTPPRDWLACGRFTVPK